MTVEHRRPLLAFIAVVALAIAIVSSHLQPGQVGRLVVTAPQRVAGNLSPDTLLGRALSLVPGRPTTPDLAAARTDRAAAARAAGVEGAAGASRRDGRTRSDASASGLLGISLTLPDGTGTGAAGTSTAGSTGGVNQGKSGQPGEGGQPGTTGQSGSTPTNNGRGNGVVGRVGETVTGAAGQAGREVGRARAEAVHAAHAARVAASGIVGRLPSLTAPGTPVRSEGLVAGTSSSGPGQSGRSHGRAAVAGPPGLTGRGVLGAQRPGRAHGQAKGHGQTPGRAQGLVSSLAAPPPLVQRPVAQRPSRPAASAAPVRAPRAHQTHQARGAGRGHQAPAAAAPRAALPRAPRVETGHASRPTTSRGAKQARPDRGRTQVRPDRAQRGHAAGPARGPSGSHGHGRH